MDKEQDRRIAQWYNALSNSYDELYSREQLQKYSSVIRFFGDEKFKILVDVGCGTGMFLEGAENHYEYAVGIDLSTKMLKAAASRASQKRDLVVASSRLIPIRDKTVDCLVSVSTLSSDSDLLRTFDEIARICCWNATVAVSVFQGQNRQVPVLIETSGQSSKISDRETLYCLRLDKGRLRAASG
ncbi:class I SAM-dependent methyltransferase [Candidatus Bathyarchaeota archaeon]|nr:class I SAM-dependent methyltransferase [Candidatus Bathyarchaeota archaeon]